jgi:hypothetical protein
MRKLLLVPFLLVLTACATNSSGPRRSMSVLTADEIAELPVRTAFEAVQRMRPQWLRRRSSPTANNPAPNLAVVYVDGVRWGDVNDLNSMRVENIESMRFLGSTDATNRFGTGHTGGAIMVTTKRGRG